MPAQKPKKSVQSTAKAKTAVKKPVAKAALKPVAKKVAAKAAPKAAVKAKPVASPAKTSTKKVASVPAAKKSTSKAVEEKKTTKAKVAEAEVKKTSKVKAVAEEKPAKIVKTTPPEKKAAAKAPAKRGRKPKAGAAPAEDEDLSDIEADLEGEPAAAEPGEKVKPLRMKLSKAKERALMKEFGLDETVLSEEDMAKRRQRLKTLIKLGKTRGYLTHGEISDHLPDKLVDAETLEVVISMLNDMGVAVYEQTPNAETLLLAGNGSTAATEEEAEEEAEAALSTVDSEFGRTTDPVRMYMREMGTVELLTREGEIEIAKRIEGG